MFYRETTVGNSLDKGGFVWTKRTPVKTEGKSFLGRTKVVVVVWDWEFSTTVFEVLPVFLSNL